MKGPVMRYVGCLLTTIAIAAIAGPTAQGAIFSWDNAPSIGDQLSIKLANWEPDPNTVTSTGFLFGVGRVTEIENITAGNLAWLPERDGNLNPLEEITFVFNNYLFDAAASTADELFFTAGDVTAFYDDLTGDPQPTDPSLADKDKGTNAMPDAATDNENFSDGMVLFRALGHAFFGPGGLNTLETEITTPFTVDPVTGDVEFFAQGNGLLDVVPGSGQLADVFNSNRQTDGSDLRLSVTLQPTNATSGHYEVFSNDPINTAFIPEMNSGIVWFALVGLVAGSVFTRRRYQLTTANA